MKESYLERKVFTSVEEEYGDVNEIDILWLIDEDIVFQIHNIEEMIHNVERHPTDVTQWQNIASQNPKFVIYPRNIRITMSTNGMNSIMNNSTHNT
jgi:hypothetical protein